MIVINKSFNLDTKFLLNKFNSLDDVVLFDIETTGFSPKYNMIYMIGCIYFSNNKVHMIQWLAEKDADEYAVLYEFNKFIRSYTAIISFNGDSFDLPFINKRANFYKINFDHDFISHDIYKLLKPFKTILGLDNCKLKTVEKYLGIHRIDKLTGRELIDHYYIFTESNDITSKNYLLQHNEDDLIGMVKLTPIFRYIDFCNSLKNYTLTYNISDYYITSNHLCIILELESETLIVNKHIKEYYQVHIDSNTITIYFNLFQGELKHFFDNHKDYYYIYSEDQAMHKSVASFIDGDNKTKATASTCYIKKRGTFIPLPAMCNLNKNIFYMDKSDKTKYLCIDNKLTNDLLMTICNTLLSSL